MERSVHASDLLRKKERLLSVNGGENGKMIGFLIYIMLYSLTILPYLKKESADFSAITTWGVFYPSEDSPANLILLDAVRGRWEFPDLRRRALADYKYWNPDTVIVEAKASGLPLTYELRAVWIFQW